jgi:RNA polymerase sigma-70 factor (ECF subfamily)
MDPQKLPSQELVQLCLDSQDKAIWFEFVRRFQPLIAGVVLKSIRRWARPTPSLVDDLVQDTYLKLCANNFRALREFDCQHDYAIFGFLKVVASNVVQDHFRSSYSQKRGSGRDDEDLESVKATPAAATHPVRDMDRAILLAEVARCLQSLPADDHLARDCAIFWLYFRHGLTAKAISQLQGIGLSVKGVESTILRLIRLLRECMGAKPRR